jgi:poly-gamma-glutamate capsule biosynthesis protein CapA/YwtB (metallophosphatase superfamily)
MLLLEPRGAIRLRLAAAGDVGIIGSARARARREGYDAVLAALAEHFHAGDLGFANLEMPVGGPDLVRPGRAPEFWHEPDVVPALARAGVRVVSLANNHIMDCGPAGLERTLAACAAAGIQAVGAGRDLAAARQPARLEARGQRVVVLAYAQPSADDRAESGRPGLAPLEADLIRQDLARWRPQADCLVVSAHWGSMYVDYPPPRVLELARALAEGGADLVLGHHPHVLQGARREGRTLTLFSLGDAVFDGGAGDFQASVGAARRRESAVFVALIGDQAPGLEAQPLTLDQDGVPAGVTPATAADRARRLAELSAGLEAGAQRFHAEAAPQLLRYELEALGHYARQGRWDRILKLLGTFRPRHVGLLWHALRRIGKAA